MYHMYNLILTQSTDVGARVYVRVSPSVCTHITVLEKKRRKKKAKMKTPNCGYQKCVRFSSAP